MKIALAIVSLSEQGGLQRACLTLAEDLRSRGHEVAIFASRCVAPWSASQEICILPARGLTNHGRDRSFGRALMRAAGPAFDLVVGFNKMPGLDVYYCADPSILAKPAPAWKRALPRYRTRLALERACFEPSSRTHALMLAPDALDSYRRAWGLPDRRLFLLPPRIARDSAMPEFRDDAARRTARSARGYGESDVVWLWVAAQPATKGLDRVLEALPHHPRARLLVLGLSADGGKGQRYHHLAKSLNVFDSIDWVRHCDAVPELMGVADLLVHPARLDVTGQVILEAIANGLPVVASAVCGFAHHVREAGAGAVVPEPFEARDFDRALTLADDPLVRESWSAAALAYSRQHDFARGQEAAADVIERIAAAREDA